MTDEEGSSGQEGSHKVFTTIFSILFVLLIIMTIAVVLTRNASFEKMYLAYFAKTTALMINTLVSISNTAEIDFYDVDANVMIEGREVIVKEKLSEVFSPITQKYPFSQDRYTDKILDDGVNLKMYKGDDILLDNESKSIKYEFDCPFLRLSLDDPLVLVGADDETYDMVSATYLESARFRKTIIREKGGADIDPQRVKLLGGDVLILSKGIPSLENKVIAKIPRNDPKRSAFIACKILNTFEVPTGLELSDEEILYSADISVSLEIYGDIEIDKKLFIENLRGAING